jgi:hypothetical protein
LTGRSPNFGSSDSTQRPLGSPNERTKEKRKKAAPKTKPKINLKKPLG